MPNSNRSFLKHAAVYGFGTLLLQAASVVLLPLYTRYLTPADFGTLEILNRVGQVLGIVLMAGGISTATFAFYCQAKTPEERQRTAATVSLLLWGVLMAGALLTVALAGSLAAMLGVESRLLATVGIIAALSDSATVIPLCLAQARTESLYYVGASLAMFVCRVGMIVVAVAGLGLGLWGVLWASIATAALFAVVLNAREFWNTAFRPDMHIMREVARFAFPFVPGGLCFFVMSCGDRFFLVKSAGIGELGVYALGCKLASAVGIFSFTPLFKVWSARMYDAFALPNAAAVVGRACTRMLGAYVLVGLGLCLFVVDVVDVLASSQYAGATAVVAPLVLAAFFGNANTLMDGVFYAHRKTYPKPWIAFIAMLVMVGLYAWLIPQFGAMGAACAILGGNVFLAAATWTVSQRIFRVHYEYLRMAGMLIVAALFLAIGGRLDLGIMNIPAKLALWTVLPILLWTTGLVSKDEKAMAVNGLLIVLRRIRGLLISPTDEPGVAATPNDLP